MNLLRNVSVKISSLQIALVPPSEISADTHFLSLIHILIREGKLLYPFLGKLGARRSVIFGIVKVYVEKECRKIKFIYNIQGVPKKRDKSIAPLFMGGF
jgi:hypothetical protein